jgi:hypothetical protein
MWPQALCELRGLQGRFETAGMNITAAQIEMALQLAESAVALREQNNNQANTALELGQVILELTAECGMIREEREAAVKACESLNTMYAKQGQELERLREELSASRPLEVGEYNCANCGEPSGAMGHWRGVPGLVGEWTCLKKEPL